jgi:hypothetical protein
MKNKFFIALTVCLVAATGEMCTSCRGAEAERNEEGAFTTLSQGDAIRAARGRRGDELGRCE